MGKSLLFLLGIACFPAIAGAKQPVFGFYLDDSCQCHEEVHEAAMYWNKTLLVTLREVAEPNEAHIILTRELSRENRRIISLSAEQIEDNYRLTNLLGLNLLKIKSVEEGILRFGKNNLKLQEVPIGSIPEDLPLHDRDLLRLMEELRKKMAK